jgi:hypothetical protein
VCFRFVGCTDSAAANYRPLAERDDGSCRYIGCIDSTALNYDATAVVPTLCMLPVAGCTASHAINYLSAASEDDSSCLYAGCTDSSALTYDGSATVDNGRCTEVSHPGCTDSHAFNYHPAYTHDDGSCTRPGCTDSRAAGYDAVATFDDGSCPTHRRRLGHTPSTDGCMDPHAPGYDATATRHVGTMCAYDVIGCTDPAAVNYLPAATADASPSLCTYTGCTYALGTLNFDSSAIVLAGCRFAYTGCVDPSASNYRSFATVADADRTSPSRSPSLCVLIIPGP